MPAAFTIVELIVVVAVIVIILALAIPGLSAMNAEARLTGASQTINATLTRAYYLAVSDVNMTAVRFLPGEWDAPGDEGGQVATERQHMVIHRYAGAVSDPETPGDVQFNEYLKRRSGANAVELPEGIWVAPLEALSDRRVSLRSEGTSGTVNRSSLGEDFVLNGTIGDFAAEPLASSPLLNADDFLIVIDPKSGIVSGTPQAFRLWSYIPEGDGGYEWDMDGDGDVYQRFGFTGVTLYRREPFEALGLDAAGADRQALLRDIGRPYMAHRYSGGLTAGMARPE